MVFVWKDRDPWRPGGPATSRLLWKTPEECFRSGGAAPLRRLRALFTQAFVRCFRGPGYLRRKKGALLSPSVPGRVSFASGFSHVAEPQPQNAGLRHGGGAFVTPPGGGAQNGSVEKMWRREKCETKKEAPPQRERRPGRDSSPGRRRLLLFFSLALYNFVTLICSRSRRLPKRGSLAPAPLSAPPAVLASSSRSRSLRGPVISLRPGPLKETVAKK